jgi:hypothetical protein
MWYHILAFIMLPSTIIIPFILAALALRSSRFQSLRLIGHQISAVYRTKSIGHWGLCLRMIARLLLVITATFTQNPETVT